MKNFFIRVFNPITISIYLLVSLFFSSCSDNDFLESSSVIDTTASDFFDNSFNFDDSAKLKLSFSKALALAMSDNIAVRKLIKEESLKQFDKDYDVLYQLVKNSQLINGKTLREELLKYYDTPSDLDKLERMSPLLTIFVPQLPNDSFSAENWDINTQSPHVAIRLTSTNNVPIVNSKGEHLVLKGGLIPGFPVIVIKDNERLVVDTLGKKTSHVKGNSLKTNSGLSFRFLDSAFDARQDSKSISKRVYYNLDQKIIDAYDIYANADGWHRDYLYYGLTPSNQKGPYSLDFGEHITNFSLQGDAESIYRFLSDQKERVGGIPEDPSIIPAKFGIGSSSWTGGNFEFTANAIVNSKNGLGDEFKVRFSARGDQLFTIIHEEVRWPWMKLYVVKDIWINGSGVPVNGFLFNWDISKYASSVKIDVEEIDTTVEVVTEDTRTVSFANNFELSTTIKKVGLKFGAKFETTEEQTIKKTYTEGSDKLGYVIINFGDKIITDRREKNGTTYYVTRDYKTSKFKINVEPRRLQ